MTDLIDVHRLISDVVESTSIASVFLAALLEKFLPILPSYILFPAVGMGASNVGELLLRCLVATLGSVGGAMGWYLAGWLIGPSRISARVHRFGSWFLLTPRLYNRLAAAYAGDPFRITLAAQLVPAVRVFQGLPAGVLQIPLRQFLVATAIGAQCWIVPLASAGYLIRHQDWQMTQAGAGPLVIVLLSESILLLIAFGAVRKRFI